MNKDMFTTKYTNRDALKYIQEYFELQTRKAIPEYKIIDHALQCLVDRIEVLSEIETKRNKEINQSIKD